MRIEEPQRHLSYNYAKTDWKELNRRLEIYLPNPINEEAMTANIDNHGKQLVEVITKAVQETTSRKCSNPHSKR